MSIIDTDNITPYNDGYMDGENNIKEELINNVSNWLYENFYEHPHEKNFICTESFKSMDKMIENFIKYIS